jgi:hypothetical protein
MPTEITDADAANIHAAVQACLAVAAGYGLAAERLPTVFANLLVLTVLNVSAEESQAEALEAIFRDMRLMAPLHRAQLQAAEGVTRQ